jgi:hypothetical protein
MFLPIPTLKRPLRTTVLPPIQARYPPPHTLRIHPTASRRTQCAHGRTKCALPLPLPLPWPLP